MFTRKARGNPYLTKRVPVARGAREDDTPWQRFVTEVESCNDMAKLLRMHREQEQLVKGLITQDEGGVAAIKAEMERRRREEKQKVMLAIAGERTKTKHAVPAAAAAAPKKGIAASIASQDARRLKGEEDPNKRVVEYKGQSLVVDLGPDKTRAEKLADRDGQEEAKHLLEEFYKLLSIPPPACRNLAKILASFDTNGDSSVTVDEFRLRLEEPRERLPLLTRLFLSLDNEDVIYDDITETETVLKDGVLDAYEFIVGYYSICAMPAGDYMIRALWDMYDLDGRGFLKNSTFRQLLRETMGASLPEYLIRPSDDLPDDVLEQIRDLRALAAQDPWRSMRVGDLAQRIDRDGHRHLAVIREKGLNSISLQDVYTVHNPMGWSAGSDNIFTYDVKRYHLADKVDEHEAGDDVFDDQLEKFLVLSADKNGDGSVTLREFREFCRKRVAKGEPSPYATMLHLQKKLRGAGPGLSADFWAHRTEALHAHLQRVGLWSAKELYDACCTANVWDLADLEALDCCVKLKRRPPKRYGGERPDDPDAPFVPYHRRRRVTLQGEEIIHEALRRGFAATFASDSPDDKDHGGHAAALMRAHVNSEKADRAAADAVLKVVVLRAANLSKFGTFFGAPNPQVDASEIDQGQLSSQAVLVSGAAPTLESGRLLRLVSILSRGAWMPTCAGATSSFFETC